MIYINKQKLINNTFIILYPILLIFAIHHSSILGEQISKMNVNNINSILILIIYFISFVYFIFKFLIKRNEFDVLSLFIGIAMILLTLFQPFFNKVSAIIYNQIEVTLFVLGMNLTLYALAYIAKTNIKDS